MIEILETCGISWRSFISRYCVPAALALKTAAGGLLARLRAAKKARIGIANQPPFSALNPDGTVTGVGPEIAKVILGRLGDPKGRGCRSRPMASLFPACSPDAGISSPPALTISKERCTQVLFSDPVTFEGPGIFSVTGRSYDQPEDSRRTCQAGCDGRGSHWRCDV